MALGKMFLVERSTFVVIRDELDQEVGFSSFEDFYKYCPIGEFNVDLTGKEYIDYEPDRNLYLDGESNLVDNIPNASFEGLISNIDVIKGRVDDPFYGLTLEEAKTLKKQQLQVEAYATIIAKWPIYTQLNLNAGILPAEDKTQKDNDVQSVQSVCNSKESEVDSAVDVTSVKAVTATWPTL